VTPPGNSGCWPWAAAIQSPAIHSPANARGSRRLRVAAKNHPLTSAKGPDRRDESVSVRGLRKNINGADEGMGGSRSGRNTGPWDCVTSRKVSGDQRPAWVLVRFCLARTVSIPHGSPVLPRCRCLTATGKLLYFSMFPPISVFFPRARLAGCMASTRSAPAHAAHGH